jgi:hypothetical protein
MNAGSKDDLTGMRNIRRDTQVRWKKGNPTLLGNVVLLGKGCLLPYWFGDDSLMKTTLSATSLEQLTLGMTLLKLKLTGDITGTADAGDDTSEIEIEIDR